MSKFDPGIRAIRAIRDTLGTDVVAWSPVPWGDTGATWRTILADGRVFASRRYVGSGALAGARLASARLSCVADAGIAVPHPMHVVSETPAVAWLLVPWIDGPTGANELGEVQTSAALASAMGSLAAKLATVDGLGLDLASDWADPAMLASSAKAWLASVASRIDVRTGAVVSADIERVAGRWGDGPHWQMGLAHGDFAPINVIRAVDGHLVLLDLDDLARAPQILDIAWWGWVVRYHHPAAWAAGWTDLLVAAGIDPAPDVDRDATVVGRLRCLQRAAEALDPLDRTRWTERLEASATW